MAFLIHRRIVRLLARGCRRAGRVAGFIALALMVALGTPAAAAAAASAKEYQIKAVFLLNFVHFAEWPERSFADARSPIRIAVLGDDVFATALEAVVQGEQSHGRSIRVVRYARSEDIRDCQIVFVSKAASALVPAVVKAFAGKPVLTVADVPDFARSGGMINFYLEGQKVRFEVNRGVTQRSGLKLSSQMLGLARIVG